MKQINIFLGILFLCLTSSFVHAQVTTATLVGQIDDVNGEALIGAAITALHEPSGVLYGTTTRVDGSFTLPNLKVGGPYTIEASYVGYKNAKVENVRLQLAQKLWLEFELEEASLDLGEVVISAQKSDILNNERTGASTMIDNELIQSLPTISRSTADYYRLTPSASGGSFAGRNDQFNNFSLDGSIFNNPFGLDAATPGGQSDAAPISLDAIEQIQVSVAPYDITQSGFTGAAINAVTKSGTNQFHGTVFGFYRNQDLTGSKVSGEDIVVPDISQIQSGFSLGGPIVKNKVFFFVNAEVDRREVSGSNFVANRAGATGNVSRVLASDLDMVSQLLFDRYGYVTGPYENFSHDVESTKGIAKLDFNLSNNHKLTATYNFLDAFRQQPAHPSAISRRGPDATTLQFKNSGYQINNKLHSGILELNSIFGNQYSNKFQVGYTTFRDSRDPFSSQFPVINISKDGIPYIVAGHEPFSIHNILDQNVFQATNNFNIYLKQHSLTVGASFERFEFNNSFNLVGYGFGVFGSSPIEGFADLINSGALDADVANAQSRNLENDDEWALAETNVGQFAFYAQDEFQATDRLTLTLGVRMDLPMYFDTEDNILPNTDAIDYFDPEGNTTRLDNTKLPDASPLISPRLGFNLKLDDDATSQIRGGSGLFTGRLPFVWIGNQVANPFTGFLNVTSSDFKFPQVWRTNIGFDKRFESGTTLSADFIYTKDINAPYVQNWALGTPSSQLQGVDNRPYYLYGQDVVVDPNSPFGAPAHAYVFNNENEGRSINASVQVKKQFSNGIHSSLAYNYLDAQDLSSIEAEISSDAFDRNPSFGNTNNPQLAPSIYGSRHRIIGTISKSFKFGTTISAFFEYAQGNRYSYTYSGDANGDTSPLNDLLYIPTAGEIDQMTFSGTSSQQAAQRNSLEQFIIQDDYLSENRGDYVEKYGILAPWHSTWDVRILQDIKFGNGSNGVQLSLDILNIGNLISSNWGVRQFPVNTQPIGVSVDSNQNPTYSFDSSLQNTYTDDFGLNSRWQMQFGLRYTF